LLQPEARSDGRTISKPARRGPPDAPLSSLVMALDLRSRSKPSTLAEYGAALRRDC